MIPPAELIETAEGLVPHGEGWFVLNAREAPWRQGEGRGAVCPFEGAPDFPQIGVNLTVLGPGDRMAMYHREADQENFLVLAGEALLIVEVEGSPEEIDDQLSRIERIAATFQPLELRRAKDAGEAARIWLGRKSAFGAMGQMADYICLDGTIPVSQLGPVLGRIRELSDSYGLRVANVFHAGDGNMHPLILFDANSADGLHKAEALGADILRLCVEMGGCLTGEHGVGVEKRDLMTDQFSVDDLEAQMRVKDAFDPGWLLNPAKVFPLAVSEGRRQAA